MNVLCSHTRPRLERFAADDEQGAVGVSITAIQNEVLVDVEINGVREERYVSLRWLAEVLSGAVREAETAENARTP